MKTLQIVSIAAVSLFVAGFTASAMAADLDTIQKKIETGTGHAENIKKDGSQGAQNAQGLKVPETMKNAGNAKDEGKKLKDVVTGK